MNTAIDLAQQAIDARLPLAPSTVPDCLEFYKIEDRSNPKLTELYELAQKMSEDGVNNHREKAETLIAELNPQAFEQMKDWERRFSDGSVLSGITTTLLIANGVSINIDITPVPISHQIPGTVKKWHTGEFGGEKYAVAIINDDNSKLRLCGIALHMTALPLTPIAIIAERVCFEKGLVDYTSAYRNREKKHFSVAESKYRELSGDSALNSEVASRLAFHSAILEESAHIEDAIFMRLRRISNRMPRFQLKMLPKENSELAKMIAENTLTTLTTLSGHLHRDIIVCDAIIELTGELKGMIRHMDILSATGNEALARFVLLGWLRESHIKRHLATTDESYRAENPQDCVESELLFMSIGKEPNELTSHLLTLSCNDAIEFLRDFYEKNFQLPSP